jgi:cytochrome b pre-mRNA-processing protein 3
MLRFLFPRLTPDQRGSALFAAITAKAREPHWYVAGEVPDTIDGRFRVLATLCALVTVRLEAFGPAGEAASVGLTERFIEVMETEHREIGLGDPSLGKKVRKLVGSLARRVTIWREAVAGAVSWDEATVGSLYGDEPDADALEYSSAALRSFWDVLSDRTLEQIAGGDI